MSGKNKLFETEFMGYKKSDVVDYMEKLDKNGARLKEELEKVRLELDQANERILTLQKLCAEQRVAVSAHEKQKEQSEQAGLRIASLEQENQKLKQYIQDQELSQKNKKEEDQLNSQFVYEKLASDVRAEADKVLAHATGQATETIAATRQQALEIIASAKQQARTESDKITRESKGLLEENLKKVKYLYRRRDELKLLFAEQKKKTDEFFESVENAFQRDGMS